MADITITIPDENVTRVIEGVKGIYPVPQIEDPENPGEYIDEYGPAAWAKIILIDFLKRTVKRHEQSVASTVAKAAVNNIAIA